MKQLYSVLITNDISYEAFADTELPLKKGDAVVVKCDHYLDYGVITRVLGEPMESIEEFEQKKYQNSKGRHIEGQKAPIIQRLLTEEDKLRIKENGEKAQEAHRQTKERIRAHSLDMKLIQTHYALDRKMLLFLFSADGRVDFRELLKDLSILFRIRVELRQVGVRDEAAVLGGIGTCGRSFCCSTFLHTFNSINVKMAKQQGMSLNPQNISGCCGRLKCCLYYEADTYKDAPVSQERRFQATGDELDEKELSKMDEREAIDKTLNQEEERGARPYRSQRTGGLNRRDSENSRPNRGENSRPNRGENSRPNRGENSRPNRGENNRANRGENRRFGERFPNNERPSRDANSAKSHLNPRKNASSEQDAPQQQSKDNG